MPPRTVKAEDPRGLLAIKLEHSYTKDQILAKYLNTVYFGHGAYGGQAAAQTYFGKHASELTVLESATLVGRAPRARRSTTRSTARTTTSSGATTRSTRWRSTATSPADADRLKAKPCCGTIPDGQAQIKAPHGSAYFVDYTRRDLMRQVQRGEGVRRRPAVTTTLDMDKQAAALDAVTRTCPTPTTTPPPRSSRSTRTRGRSSRWYGGRNFNKSKVNLATGKGGTGRQAGSAFKAFTLAAAMQAGFTLNAYWQGPATITIPDPACYTARRPVDACERRRRGEPARSRWPPATAHSVNTVFAQVVTALDGGPQDVVDMAHRLGIRSPLEPVCSITLGTQAVTPLEMTNAYATLAARGWRHRATPLVQVEPERTARST